MTAAQLINILYNVVDRMYIGRIAGAGRLALTGVGLCLPIISILIGFANLCGMGGAPLCSISRGRGENGEAERIMGNSFTLLLLFGTGLTVFFLLLKGPVLYLFGASDVTFPYADAYLSIYLTGTLFVMIGLGLNPFINSQGFGRTGMLTVALGAVLNIILDPILIFGFDMGVRGAALATVFSQACSAAWVLRFLTGEKAILRLRLSCLRLEWDRVRRILGLGLAGFIMSLTNSLVQVVCNATLQQFGGDLYVGVMTIINSVREVINMPILGLTNAAQPVLGFNYGAGEYGRVRKGILFTFTITLCSALLAWCLVMLIPGLLIRVFNSDAALISAGMPAFRLYYAAFFMMAFQMAGQTAFVSLGRSRQAVFFSLLRKAVIVAPLTVLLPRLGLGVNGVFLAEPVSNIIGGLACFLTMFFTVYRPLEKREKEEEVLS